MFKKQLEEDPESSTVIDALKVYHGKSLGKILKELAVRMSEEKVPSSFVNKREKLTQLLKFIYNKLREQESIHISKAIDPQNNDKSSFGSLDLVVKDSRPLSLLPYIEPGIEEAHEMDRVLQALFNNI